MTESAYYNEILAQGQMQAMRQDLIDYLRIRFPATLTTEVEHAITDQPNLQLLRE